MPSGQSLHPGQPSLSLGHLPPVSVMILSYNQRNYIEAALESALSNGYPNLEVVVSDDASADGTREEIEAIAKQNPDKLVAILNSDRAGLTVNSNRALGECTGKYVCFLGGDDLFLPGKISAQVEWLEARPERVLCGHQVEVFYEDGSPSHAYARRLTAGSGAGDIIRHGPFAACSTMIRADKIPTHGFDDKLSLVGDFLLAVEVLADGGEFGFVPGTYARYRRHGSNVSGDIAAMAIDAQRALDLIEERYPQYAADCRRARARATDSLGVQHLRDGHGKAAREAFVDAIRLDPFFAKPWVRLAQTLLPR